MHQLAEKDFITITLHLFDSYPLFALMSPPIGNVYYQNEIVLMQYINRIHNPFYPG